MVPWSKANSLSQKLSWSDELNIRLEEVILRHVAYVMETEARRTISLQTFHPRRRL